MHSKMFGRKKIRLHYKGCGYTEGVAKKSLTVFLALTTIMFQIGKKKHNFFKGPLMEKFSQRLIPFGPVVLEKKTEMHKFPLGE
jgi:hypothetical protein